MEVSSPGTPYIPAFPRVGIHAATCCRPCPPSLWRAVLPSHPSPLRMLLQPAATAATATRLTTAAAIPSKVQKSKSQVQIQSPKIPSPRPNQVQIESKSSPNPEKSKSTNWTWAQVQIQSPKNPSRPELLSRNLDFSPKSKSGVQMSPKVQINWPFPPLH